MQGIHAMNKKLLAVVAVVAGAACAEGPASPQENPSERLIRSEFASGASGTALSVSREGASTLVEVCFDRCDYFQWDGPPKGLAWDFVLLYELTEGFGASAGALMPKASELVPALLQTHSAYCRVEPNAQGGFACSWPKFATSQGIRVGMTSYDEGQRCFSWRDLATMAWPDKSDCAPITKSPWSK
jgi:hypothetical protein